MNYAEQMNAQTKKAYGWRPGTMGRAEQGDTA